MENTGIIGPGKSYEPPFRVMEPVNVFTDWGIEDSTGTPFGWGFYNAAVAQHVCDLLNKEHAEAPRENSPRDEQIREVNPYKNYDTDPWMDDVRDWCRYQGFNEGARWADAHPVDSSGRALSETIGKCDGYREYRALYEHHYEDLNPADTGWDRLNGCASDMYFTLKALQNE